MMTPVKMILISSLALLSLNVFSETEPAAFCTDTYGQGVKFDLVWGDSEETLSVYSVEGNTINVSLSAPEGKLIVEDNMDRIKFASKTNSGFFKDKAYAVINKKLGTATVTLSENHPVLGHKETTVNLYDCRLEYALQSAN